MTDQQLFGYILRWVPIAVVLFAATQLAKRRREVDSAGNPTLRMWSTCFIGIMAGFFWLWTTWKHVGGPYYQRYPDDKAVDVFFCVSSFLLGAWGYCYKITLTSNAITRRYLPLLTRVYPLESVEKVEPMAKDNAKILLSDGRKITVLPLFSGRPHFLEKLGTLLSQQLGTKKLSQK
jgi:hypothetical protein